MLASSDSVRTAAREGTRRARPLPPHERRAALVAATLPLMREHGADVSTRQIAQAAGVAEGTIFRVFPDKESLLRATVDSALDPAPVAAQLDTIDMAAPLERRLAEAVRITQSWLTSVIVLMMALQGDHERQQQAAARRRSEPDVIAEKIVRLIEPDRNQLRVPPQHLARLLRLMVFSSSHPVIAEGKPLAPQEIVSVVLDGVRSHDAKRPETQEREGEPPC